MAVTAVVRFILSLFELLGDLLRNSFLSCFDMLGISPCSGCDDIWGNKSS